MHEAAGNVAVGCRGDGAHWGILWGVGGWGWGVASRKRSRPRCHFVPRGKLRRIVGSFLVCLALATLEIADAQTPQIFADRVANQRGAVHFELTSRAIGRTKQVFFDDDSYRLHVSKL